MTATTHRRRPLPKWVKACVIVSQKSTCKDCGWPLKGAEGTEPIHFDHRPPLADREWNETIEDFWPPQHHPSYIEALCVSCHDKRTHGPGGEKRITTAGSDSNRRAKARRIAATQSEHTARMAQKEPGKRARRKSRWPSRPLKSASRWPPRGSRKVNWRKR